MMSTAVLDMVIGVLLLLNLFVWVAAFVGAIHVVIVFIASGINDITVRDVAILCCSAALAIDALPELIISRFPLLR